ncbi:MAG: NAD(P)/FAD-dependent oxidoreductase [Rivularia sp. (in: cyanobacteria)]
MSKEYFDVVIVGAGLSGVDAAYHLQKKCPQKTYAILEARKSMGGTWDLFRYPGIRSDSDMYTFAYKFKPWQQGKAIAEGSSILNYLRETATENGIDKHIRYGYSVKKASFNSSDATWIIEAESKDTNQTVYFKCNFLVMCSGYYSYEEGYTPQFKNRDRFHGEIIHPQKWREDIDYQGKKVVVIGSGATAATLIPEMAKKAEHVVMLQRSPSYFISRSNEDANNSLLTKLLPARLTYLFKRWKSIIFQQKVYHATRTKPEEVKQKLLDMVRKELGPDYDIETHFTPRYNPWDQRLCVVPNGDLFQAIKSGKASVVTDSINSFTEKGILLESGKELETDIIVTATGLNIVVLGNIEFTIDAQPLEFSNTYTYKGMMYSDVPNMISFFGYVNATWTLRADMIAEYVCRIINYMDKTGASQCTPRLRDEDRNMPKRPLIEGFSSGYIQRVMHLLPKQGDRQPWISPQNYDLDKKMIRHSPIEDGVLTFENPIKK